MADQEPENESSLEWSVNTSQLVIRESKVVLLKVSKLSPHPDNRPLGTSEEKIKQLKSLIAHGGFDSSHPIVVRPYSQGYQIIEGEHRFKAAKSLGYLELPCVIRDLTDTEALIQLVLGNIQSESKPLEIGLNALKVIQKEQGLSVIEYAQRLGLSETSIRRYMNASEVFQFIATQLPEGANVLDEVYKLEEIHRCPQSDWVWLHDLITKHNLSKVQVIEISQSVREIKTDNAAIYGLFDFMKIRQDIADEIRKGGDALAGIYKDLIQTLENSYDNLDQTITLYEYNVLNDTIDQENIDLKNWFINSLKELKNITKQNVLETYKDALQLKRSSSREEAERTAAYFRDKKNAKEREEQERIEREMRQVKEGEWWQLGDHFLFCGDGASAEFYARIPNQAAFAFANPPALQEVKNKEGKIFWQLDWLIEKAAVVVVTPEIDKIQYFLGITQMPYRWSMSAQLGVKKAEAGLGSWIYTALFSQKNIDSKVADTWKVDSSDLKGNKTQDFLSHLMNAFSREQEVIIDTHAGLGTMFMLAEKGSRICYGAEVNPGLCKEIIEKWEDETGYPARRLEKS